MSEKKINGYVIHTKEVLGKGSYGSVLRPPPRSTAANRTTPNEKSQLKSYKKNSVLLSNPVNQDEYLKSALLS